MTLHTFAETKGGYANLWDKATILPERVDAVSKIVTRIATNRSVFVWVEQHTGVPWWMTACMLYRESDLDFGTYLGNGQPLDKVTTLVPAGRGPFKDFYDGALDAISLQGFAGIDPADWTIERALYWMERFNGQGYWGRCNSPYLWSWTNQYTSGKFVRDGVFDPNTRDQQCGCAAILKQIEAAGLVTFTREATKTAAPTTTQAPTMVDPIVPTTTSHPVTTTAAASHNMSLQEIIQHAQTAVGSLEKIVPVFGGFVPSQFQWTLQIPGIVGAILHDVDSIQATFTAGGNTPKAIAMLLRDIAAKLDPATS